MTLQQIAFLLPQLLCPTSTAYNQKLYQFGPISQFSSARVRNISGSNAHSWILRYSPFLSLFLHLDRFIQYQCQIPVVPGPLQTKRRQTFLLKVSRHRCLLAPWARPFKPYKTPESLPLPLFIEKCGANLLEQISNHSGYPRPMLRPNVYKYIKTLGN